MKVFWRVLLAAAMVLGMFSTLAAPKPASADAEYGYLWSLDFEFESNYNGVLTIKVGPWKNGNLVSVDKTSRAMVECRPMGSVALNAGDAVFDGGYLECYLDLASVVWANHGLAVAPVDNYGSILVRAKVNSSANTVAPLFTHPDASYKIDFTSTFAVTPSQKLWNNAGVLQATFPGVTINTWQPYTYQYACVWGGPCDASFQVGPQMQNVPTAGDRVRFSTGPTNFEIGRDGGDLFYGRMASLHIDPGNSAH
ncbi:MAG: hypothetical protein KDI03_18075 [Anaerolineae bacterium]|nr:hypothetical protein [Anaerolineae bacterium]MCB0201978.1 hypothetical protein [Anaerolineae bacterium]MCB0203503.1 hypothetical protein [Anaerolineae bacterium]MCB0254114.1 hypothetical protein [Anaerolineae bacterium]